MRASLRKIANWFTGLFTSPSRPVPRGNRLHLEGLEERVVLSTFAGTDQSVASRCACPFCSGHAMTAATSASTADAYVLGGGGTSAANATKWSQPGGLGTRVTITYSFANLLDGGMGGGLSAATLRAAVQEALGRWATFAPLNFVEVADSGPAFTSVDQADYNASGRPMLRFGHVATDGPSGILAQAYYPGQTGLAGDLFFDQSESWSVSPAGGIDFLEVAVHEIGHALGLNHQPSSQSAAIMNPIYGRRYSGLGTSYLMQDDINGIRALYGAGPGSVTPLGTTPTYDGRTYVAYGNTLYIFGTTGNDSFVYNASTATPTISVNGVAYSGSLAGITSIRYDGRGGDVATLVGSSAAERYSLGLSGGTVTGGRYALTLVSTADIRAYGGAGDTISMMGNSTTAESFSGSSNSAIMVSGSLRLSGYNFQQVTVDGGGGGDIAAIAGTAGNESYVSTPSTSTVTGSGWVVYANNFARVTVTGYGGRDRAVMYDSAGNDTFATYPIIAWMSGPGYLNIASGFSQVVGVAGQGSDYAIFYGSTGADVYICGAGFGTMYGTGYENVAYGFEAYNTNANQGGSDRISFIDSSGSDYFVGAGRGGYFYMPSGVATYFSGFGQVYVTSAYGDINYFRLSGISFSIALRGSWFGF